MNQPGRILGAQDYLQQAIARGLPFAIVVGGAESGKEILVRRFLQDETISHSVILTAPTRDRHAFLERILEQLGFEPFESSTDELEKLLCVFARHEAAQDRRTVIVLEDAQDFGPRILQAIRAIVSRVPTYPAPLCFLLTGTASLHRILDSAAMADLNSVTHWRYSLDDREHHHHVLHPAVEVTLQGKLVDRMIIDQPRLMLGRHDQNDLLLDNRFVSRHHALLVAREDGIYVVDLRSTNGTFVNGEQVHKHALQDGDVLQIGHFRLRYCEPLGAEMPSHEDLSEHTDTGVLGPQAVAS